MSRSIQIQVKYRNNKTASRGVHNGMNAEYHDSKITTAELIAALKSLEKHVGDKAVKEVEVHHHITTSIGVVERVTHYYPNLGFVWPDKLVKINTLLFQPYVK